jgi:uncharacterized protein YjbJ (UPF0337 family)
VKFVTILAVGLIAATVGFFVYASQTGQDPRELYEGAKARAKKFDMDDAMGQIQRRMGKAEDAVQDQIADAQRAAEGAVDDATAAVENATEAAPA